MRVLTHRDRLITGHINGADTYSADIEKYQLANWEKILGEDDIISFCPLFSQTLVEGKYNNAIQYLHSYPYLNPVERIHSIIKSIPFRYNKLIFITAYKDFVYPLEKTGLNAVYIPMSIDTAAVRKHDLNLHKLDGLLWFGNIKQNKVNVYNQVKIACRDLGMPLDTISINKFNKNTTVSQEESWAIASRYKYGVAVGRCAQELNALGVKTVIAGQKVGGLMRDDNEYEMQLATNMNGRIYTFSQNARICIRNVENSIIRHQNIADMNHAEMFLSQIDL